MALIDKHPEMASYISELEWFKFLREQTIAMIEIPEMQLRVKAQDQGHCLSFLIKT